MKMENKRVYVGNLAYSVSWNDLKEFMRTAGQVLRADVLSSANGQSRGCGIVEFASAQDAQNAIATLNNVELKGRPVFVREDREPPSGGLPNAVFVGNLPFYTTWQALKDLFKSAGRVTRADVHTTPQRRSKGHATVVLASEDEAKEAIRQFDGYVLDGRTLEVREDRPLTERPQRNRDVDSSGTAGFAASMSPLSAGSNAASLSGSSGNSGIIAPIAPAALAASFNSTGNAFLYASSHGEPSDTIHVANLPWSTTDNDLVDLFQSIAPLARAQIQTFANGSPAGTGVVRFLSPVSAQQAISQLNGYTYGSLQLAITYARYSPQ